MLDNGSLWFSSRRGYSIGRKAISATALFVLTMNCFALAALANGSATKQPPQSPAAPSAGPTLTSPGVKLVSASYLNTLRNLTIGTGSTIVVDVSKSNGTAAVHGNITNNGQLFFISSNSAVQTAIFSTGTLHNAAGALLSTTLSNGLLSYLNLAGNGTPLPKLNLTVNAHAILNAGKIVSSNALVMNSGTIVDNKGIVQAAGPVSVLATSIANTGILKSNQNLELLAVSGAIRNSGQIVSANGNINVDANTGRNLVVNNISGLVQAKSGIINIRNRSFRGNSATSVIGGVLDAPVINFNGGNGNLGVNVEKMTGTVNTVAYSANVGSHADSLTLGKVKQTGDPTYFNTSGPLNITGDLTVGEDLVILSAGDISATVPVVIQARGNNGQGFNITLVAGANVTGTAIGPPPPELSAGSQASTATFSGASASGGSISLPGSTINSNSTCSGCSGGSVTIAAFPDSSGTAPTGSINLNNATVNAGGQGFGNNGNIALIAGANSLTTGTLNASSGAGTASGTGVISLSTAVPTTSNGQPIAFNSAGKVTTGNSIIGGTQQFTSNINITGDISGRLINMNASGDIVATPLFIGQILGAYNESRLSPDSSKLYTVSTNNNTFSVIDTSNNLVRTTTAVGAGPSDLSINTSGTRAYVSNLISGTISVLDISTNVPTVVATVAVPTAGSSAFNYDGSLLYVASGSNVLALDTKTNTIVNTIPIGGAVSSVVFNRANNTFYVATAGGSQLTLIDARTNNTTTEPLGFATLGNIGPCPCGTKLLIPDQVGSQVASFSTADNQIVGTASLPAERISVLPNGGEAYVTANSGGTYSLNTFEPLTEHATIGAARSGTATALTSGYLNSHPTIYVSNFAGSIDIFRTPIISGPQTNLTAGGRIIAATTSTSVSASGVNSVVVTSDGNLVSRGGTTSGQFQYATTGNIVNNGTISGDVVDLHALNGTFTNNSSIIANNGILLIAAPNIVNNGVIKSNDPGIGPLAFQSPSGILNIVLNGNSSLVTTQVSTDVSFNLAGGTVINLSGNGSILEADPQNSNVDFVGSPGVVVNATIGRIDGSINFIAPPASINVVTLRGDLFVCGCVDMSASASSPGNGGPMSFYAAGGALTVEGPLTSDGYGVGNHGGDITLHGATSVAIAGSIESAGFNGASGGNVRILSDSGPVGLLGLFQTPVSTAATGGGNGGNITISGTLLNIFDVGGSTQLGLDSSSTDARAGNIFVRQTAISAPFEIGLFCPTCAVGGDITANGPQAGRVDIYSGGPIIIDGDCDVTATGGNGFIQLANTNAGGALIVQNDGIIDASPSTPNVAGGSIGFNSGTSQAVTVTGQGTIFADRFVSFGFLNSLTLLPINAIQINPPSRSNFTAGRISVSQGADVDNEILVSGSVVPSTPFVPLTSAQSSSTQSPISASIVAPTFPGLFDVVLPPTASSTILPTDQVYQPFPVQSGPTYVQTIIRQEIGASAWIDGIKAFGLDDILVTSQSVRATINRSANTVRLTHGNVLFLPTSRMSVETPMGTLTLDAGSIVFVMVSDNSVNAYNLQDDRNGAVMVDTGDYKYMLTIGMEALITNLADSEFAKFSGPSVIPTRGLKRTPLSAGRTLFGAAFSLPTAMLLIKPVRELKVGQTQNQRLAYEHMVRNAAILNLMTAGNGPYKASQQ